MGVKPSGFKQGGFLNGKDVTWVGYAFQAKTFIASTGENAGEPFTPVNIELRFRIDGADEDVKTWLPMGRAESWGQISSDGQQIATPDGQSLSNNSQLGIFVSSLVEAGLPETELDADDSPDHITFANLVMRRPRLRLVTPVNTEKTEKFGQQKNRKTGRSFDRRDLRVEKFYGFSATGGQKGSGTAQGASGKPNGSGTVDVADLTTQTVLAVLKDAGGSIIRTKLPLKITAKLGNKHGSLEAVRKLALSVPFLEGLDSIVYDAESGTLSAV